jgi:hypothetical protein
LMRWILVSIYPISARGVGFRQFHQKKHNQKDKAQCAGGEKMNKTLIVALIYLLCAGCKKRPGDHGEFIKIEVMLKNGGTATLRCPEFDSEPPGAHGRECYLSNGT